MCVWVVHSCLLAAMNALLVGGGTAAEVLGHCQPRAGGVYYTSGTSTLTPCNLLNAHTVLCDPFLPSLNTHSPHPHSTLHTSPHQGVLNGREIFLQDNFVAQDDANAGDADEYAREDDDEARINDMFEQVGRLYGGGREVTEGVDTMQGAAGEAKVVVWAGCLGDQCG